jgi:hypothetical protein
MPDALLENTGCLALGKKLLTPALSHNYHTDLCISLKNGDNASLTSP